MVEEKEEEPKKQEEEEARPNNNHHHLCDFCGESRAVLYCRADTARLCLSCDRHVHLANSVSSKHPRSLLCDSCSSAPSSIFCSSHALVLCSNCDFEAHGRGAVGAHHDRRPVDSLSGCPAAVDLVPALGLAGSEELLSKKKKKKKIDADDDVFGEINGFWEIPTVVRLDDLIVPTTNASHGFQAMGVPPLPKNRNLACGKQKEEIVQQLRDLIRSEGGRSNDCEESDPISEFQPLMPCDDEQPDNSQSDFLSNATFTVSASELQWNDHDWQEAAATDPTMFCYDEQQIAGLSVVTSFPDGGAVDFNTNECPAGGSDGDPGRHYIAGESLSPLTPKRGLVELLCPDRDSAISRYKEKRKTRRYGKLIRYESRKARADSRVRIKGRFAKANQVRES